MKFSKTRMKMAVAGAVTGLAMLVVTAGPLSVQARTAPEGGAPTHQQMHQMMDAMHGKGTSERMHKAMGKDAEQMMDQCTSMMGMMNNMGGMMGDSSMGNMMNGMMGR